MNLAHGITLLIIVLALAFLIGTPIRQRITMATHEYLHAEELNTWISSLDLARCIEKERDGWLCYDSAHRALLRLETEELVERRTAPRSFSVSEYPCALIMFRADEFRLTAKGVHYRETLSFGDPFTQHRMLPEPPRLDA